MNVFVVEDNEEVLAMSCLTATSRLDGWHFTTDGEPSFTSFPLRGLQLKNRQKQYTFQFLPKVLLLIVKGFSKGQWKLILYK